MTANVQIVISAQDRASSVVAGVEKSFVSMGTRLKTAGHNILTGIFAEQTVITRTAHLFDQKMHTAFAPVIASLFLAGDLIQPFGGAITGALGRVAKAGPVMAASAALGGAIGAIQAEAQALAATGTAAVSGMATRIAAMSIPLAASGTTVGGLVGGAMSAAMWGALVAAPAIGAKVVGDKLYDTVTGAFGGMSRNQLLNLGAPVGRGFGEGAVAAARTEMMTLPHVVGVALASPFDISGLLSHIRQAGIDVRAVWDKSAQALDGDLASALQNNTNVIDTAMEKVKWALQHPLELAAQENKIQAAIVTLQTARGLASNTPEVNKVIDQQIAGLEAQWTSLAGVAYTKFVNVANSAERGLGTFHASPFDINWPRVPGLIAGAHPGGGGRAHGGPVNAGETYLVGERGPELLHMGGNGYVQAGARSAHAQADGGHGHTIVMDGRVVAQLIDERFGKKLAMASSSAYTRG